MENNVAGSLSDRDANDSNDSTRWVIRAIAASDSRAEEKFFKEWFARLTAFLRPLLHSSPAAIADEEDLSADVICWCMRGIVAGRFSRIASRAELWRLMRVAATLRFLELRRHENRIRRCGSRTMRTTPLELERLVDLRIGDEPMVDLYDEFGRFLLSLRNDQLQSIIALRLQGHEINEVAEKVGLCPRSVRRKLNVIWEAWKYWHR